MANSVDPDQRSSLIWVCTVCPDLSVLKLKIITVDQDLCIFWMHYCLLIPHCSNFRIITTWATTWQNQQSDCAPREDSDQPGHPPSLIRVFTVLRSLIRVFAVRMRKPWVLSYPLSAQRRLWSNWVDAQADLSLCWAHTHFVGFLMSRLTCIWVSECFGFLWYWLNIKILKIRTHKKLL